MSRTTQHLSSDSVPRAYPQLDAQSEGAVENGAFEVSVIEGDALPDALQSKWEFIQNGNPNLDNPYFTYSFVKTVARFSENVRIVVCKRDSKVVAFLPFKEVSPGVARPVGGCIGCMHGIIARPSFSFSPLELIRSAGLKMWRFDHLPVTQEWFRPFFLRSHESPYLDLEDGFDAYAEGRKLKGHSNTAIRNTGRKWRSLQRDFENVSFEAESRDVDVLDQIAEWKLAQLDRTGARNPDAMCPWIRSFTRETMSMVDGRFRGSLSTVSAGGRVIGAFYGLRSGGVLHGVFLGYDPEFAKYSPGMIVLIELARRCESLGLKRIDLGKGAEPYKKTISSASTIVANGAVDGNAARVALRSVVEKTKEGLSKSRLHIPLRRVVGRIRRRIDRLRVR